MNILVCRTFDSNTLSHGLSHVIAGKAVGCWGGTGLPGLDPKGSVITGLIQNVCSFASSQFATRGTVRFAYSYDALGDPSAKDATLLPGARTR